MVTAELLIGLFPVLFLWTPLDAKLNAFPSLRTTCVFALVILTTDL